MFNHLAQQGGSLAHTWRTPPAAEPLPSLKTSTRWQQVSITLLALSWGVNFEKGIYGYARWTSYCSSRRAQNRENSIKGKHKRRHQEHKRSGRKRAMDRHDVLFSRPTNAKHDLLKMSLSLGTSALDFPHTTCLTNKK